MAYQTGSAYSCRFTSFMGLSCMMIFCSWLERAGVSKMVKREFVKILRMFRKKFFIGMFLFSALFSSAIAEARSYFCAQVWSLSQLQDLQNLSSVSSQEGSGWSELYSGRFGGHQVWVKVQAWDRRLARDYVHEAKMYQELSDLPFVPRFYGLLELPDGRMALLIQRLDRMATIPSSFNSDEGREVIAQNKHRIFSQAQAMLEELSRRRVAALDFQVLLDKQDRLWLIDLEAYVRKNTRMEAKLMNRHALTCLAGELSLRSPFKSGFDGDSWEFDFAPRPRQKKDILPLEFPDNPRDLFLQ